LILILAVVALYNLVSLGYIEKYKELSTFKIVGFKDKCIGQILIAQIM
jgi:Predicted permease.